MHTILITVEGGVIQNVRVIVRDFDVDGQEPDGEDAEGCPFIESEYLPK